MTSEPETPTISSVATSPRSEAGSSYFSLVKLESSSPPAPAPAAALIDFEPVETRVKPLLTAVLNMTTDMWCGKITHHNPPMLFLGSRSSAVKLVALPLSKELIDPDRNYDPGYNPVQLFPKTTQALGMPTGHGRGIMGMDSREGRLVVGCTGGSIHVLNMDPALRDARPSKMTAPTVVVVLPPSTASNADSPPSLSPIVTSTSLASSPTSPSSLSSASSHAFSTSPKTSGFPAKSSAILKAKNTSSVISRTGSARITIPSPDRSPQAPSMISSPSTLRLRTPSPPRGTRHMKPLISTNHYEEQEVLVDCDDDDDLPIHHQRHPPHHPKPLLQSPPIRSASTSPRSSTSSSESAPSSFPKGNRIPRRPLVTLPIPPPASLHAARATSPHSPGATSSCTPAGQAFSRLTKYIPTPPSRIMRRRSSSNGDVDSRSRSSKADTSNNRASGPAIMKGRNRSNPDLLTPGHALLTVGNRQSWAHSYNVRTTSPTGR
ncbi:hypothetical protein EMPS_02020 [Entomortierella parvispora]|uniref:Uncharacterized protein n=1 Tax=Entomortierella parvispora TaxID=205924 RepID=A0A9P3H423_9FUNG|nr:hypothetical protein EMPS_02020 [Entomortierella parvispora]